MNDPINHIEWIDSRELKANDYNPNVVFTPELKLLESSILLTGWIQPILIDKEYNIIDGFHRASLSKDSKKMIERYQYKAPVCMLPLDRPQAMLMTVRINRAKGTHIATRMSEMIKELIDKHGLLHEEIMAGIGASRKEVDLLYQEGVFKARKLDKVKYSQAWVVSDK